MITRFTTILLLKYLGVRSQKTYPVGWSLTPLTALLLLGIAKLCLVVAPCQESHRLRLKGCFLWPTALCVVLCWVMWPILSVQAQNPLERMLGRSDAQGGGEISDFQETLQLKQRVEELEKMLKETQRIEAINRERLEKEIQRYHAQANRYRELPSAKQGRRGSDILQLRSRIVEVSEQNEASLNKLQSLQVSYEQNLSMLRELIDNFLKFREDTRKWLLERYPSADKRLSIERDLQLLQKNIKEQEKRLEQIQQAIKHSDQDIANGQKAFEKARQQAEADARKTLDYEKQQAELTAKAEQELADIAATEQRIKAEEEAAAAEPRRRRPTTPAERRKASQEAAARARRQKQIIEQQEKIRKEQEHQRVIFQLQSQLNRALIESHRNHNQYLQTRHSELSLQEEILQIRLRFYQYTVEHIKELLQRIAAQAKGGLLYRIPLSIDAQLFPTIVQRTKPLTKTQDNPLLAYAHKLWQESQLVANRPRNTLLLLALLLLVFLAIIWFIRSWLFSLSQSLLHPTAHPTQTTDQTQDSTQPLTLFQAEIAAQPDDSDDSGNNDKHRAQPLTLLQAESGIQPDDSDDSDNNDNNDKHRSQPLALLQAETRSNIASESESELLPELVNVGDGGVFRLGAEGEENYYVEKWHSGWGLVFAALRRITPSLMLFGALLLAGWVFAIPDALRIFVWTAAAIWLTLRMIWVLVDLLFGAEESTRLIVTMSDRDARRLRRIIRVIAIFSGLYYVALQLVYLLDYPPTAVHLLETVWLAVIAVGFLFILSKKEPMLAMIPSHHAIGRGTVRLIRLLYPLLYFMAFAILIIYALGYHSLAIFMGVRILVSILLLLSAYGLQQVIWLTALSLVSLTKRVTSLKGQRIAQGLLRVLRMIVLIITALLTVSLLLEIWGMAGGYQAILRLAQRPFFEIQGTQISLLSMFKFSVALFGSLWLSGWLRKKLGEFIYPVLRITIANRHASDTILHYGIIIIGVLAGLQWMGMGIGVLAIFAGVIGIGVGFGMQDIANNFISGLIITFGKSVKVGDIIEVNDILGTVREISARSTTLEAPDGKMLLLPNALLLTSQVINWSIGSTRAIISLPVTVKIGNRPESVQSALTELSLEHPLVLSQPPPAVYFDGFGDNTLDFRLELAITTPLERDRILSDIRFSLAQQLPHKGIEIPHSFDVRDPQTDVRP